MFHSKSLYLMSLCAVSLVATLAAQGQAPLFVQTNLVTDSQAANSARIVDPNLVNAWGISFAPTGPFWVSNNGTGTSTLYRVDPTTDAPTKLGLTVTIPGAGNVTGQNFNSNTAGGAFNADNFLFVSEDGTISGWRGALGTAAETLAAGSAANVYKGSAFATIGTHSYLYEANFRNGTVDVFKGDVGAPTLVGSFSDPSLPAGYAPFNVQVLNGKLYVTYALQDAAKHDDVAGLGNGFVDAFDLNGNLLSRVGTQGTLDSPWGLTLAPSNFGAYSGDLLVGNFGNGRINAYNLSTNSFVGQLSLIGGGLVTIDGLWGLTTGNNAASGSSGALYFSAGPNGESHGLFGSIRAVPEPGQLAYLLGMGVTGLGVALRMRRRKS